MTTPNNEPFLQDVACHQLTVHQKDRLYRHLSFSDGTQDKAFSITTWPYHLCISGDMGCYVFSVSQDMCAFMHSDSPQLRHDPEYLASNLTAPHSDDQSVRVFDYAPVHQAIQEAFHNRFDGSDDDPDWIEALQEQIEDEFLSCTDRHELMEALQFWDADTTGLDLLGLAQSKVHYRLSDCFIWCCQAVHWGIHQYYQQVVSAPASA